MNRRTIKSYMGFGRSFNKYFFFHVCLLIKGTFEIFMNSDITHIRAILNNRNVRL